MVHLEQPPPPTWKAEALVNGQWVTRAECGSKFVASLALARDQMYGGKTRLTAISAPLETAK